MEKTGEREGWNATPLCPAELNGGGEYGRMGEWPNGLLAERGRGGKRRGKSVSGRTWGAKRRENGKGKGSKGGPLPIHP